MSTQPCEKAGRGEIQVAVSAMTASEASFVLRMIASSSGLLACRGLLAMRGFRALCLIAG
jgi:hypothetical protein